MHNQLDHNQQKIKDKLEDILQLRISRRKSWFFRVKNFFSQNITKRHIYLYGKVGRGKTMLMNQFYQQFPYAKKMQHFQQFMQELHGKLHQLKLQKIPLDKCLKQLALSISEEIDLLCLDEFEIYDITDAMLVMRLFHFLDDFRVMTFVTTNIRPSELYKDGLQREAFLPFIQRVEQTYHVLNLDSEIDYRYQGCKLQERIFAPADEQSHKIFARLKKQLAVTSPWEEGKILIFGRELKFAQTNEVALCTDFEELFERDLSYADYGQITQQYQIFMVENVRKISDSEKNIVTRFINFIDNAYYNRVLLYLKANCTLEEIYEQGPKLNQFGRVVSRLNEMNDITYQYQGYEKKK